MGHLIAIDGLDGSGKHTQASLLTQRFAENGVPARLVSFPVYESESSALVRLYLSGALGSDPGAVNAYAASSFYAMDRILTFLMDWKKDYDAGVTIIADRYTTANAIHQLGKLQKSEYDRFLDWLGEYEYDRLGVPKPDLTLFLEVPVEQSLELIDHRGRKTDIHENRVHLENAYAAAQYASAYLNWNKIVCTKNGAMLSREEIADAIWARVKEAGLILEKE